MKKNRTKIILRKIIQCNPYMQHTQFLFIVHVFARLNPIHVNRVMSSLENVSHTHGNVNFLFLSTNKAQRSKHIVTDISHNKALKSIKSTFMKEKILILLECAWMFMCMWIWQCDNRFWYSNARFLLLNAYFGWEY